MKIIVEHNDVVNAVKQFHEMVEQDNGTFDLEAVDYEGLLEAIQEEYDCGANGSVVDVLVDLDGAITLNDWGIVVVNKLL